MYEWDEQKSQANCKERGFGFDAVYEFDWALAFVESDERRDYGEPRWRAFGRDSAGLAYCIAFTQRGARIRIISMRRAHEKEVRRYGI